MRFLLSLGIWKGAPKCRPCRWYITYPPPFPQPLARTAQHRSNPPPFWSFTVKRQSVRHDIHDYRISQNMNKIFRSKKTHNDAIPCSHSIVTVNILTLTDENHERCISKQCSVYLLKLSMNHLALRLTKVLDVIY